MLFNDDPYCYYTLDLPHNHIVRLMIPKTSQLKQFPDIGSSFSIRLSISRPTCRFHVNLSVTVNTLLHYTLPNVKHCVQMSTKSGQIYTIQRPDKLCSYEITIQPIRPVFVKISSIYLWTVKLP